MNGVELYSSAREARRWTWALATPLLIWCFIQVGGRAAEFVASLVGLHASAASGRWQDNLVAMFSWGLVGAALLLWLRYWEGRGLSDIGLAGRIGGRFVAGLVGGFFLVAVVAVAGVLLGGFEVIGPGAWFDHLTPTWLFAAVLTLAGGTVQAVVKEALFRGWLMQAFALRWGAGLAIMANVAAFAGIHGMHFSASPQVALLILNLALMSWWLGRLAVRDGTVWGVAGLHTAWNLTSNLGLGLNVNAEHLNVTPMLMALTPSPTAAWWLSGDVFGPNGSLLMTVCLGMMLLAGRRRRGRARDDDADHDDEVFD